jgi:phosphatidylglycerophosphatase A
MFNKNSIAKFLTTFFYIGKIKYCPGTFGSLAAFPLCYAIIYFAITNQIIFSFSNLDLAEEQLISILFILLTVAIFLFILGAYYSSIYINNIKKEDPKEIVIDEVVGQMLVIIFCSVSVTFVHYSNITKYLNNNIIDLLFLFILPFGLFRFFDIMKPWPINWFDQNIKGGIGVMLDDVLAAIFASVIHYVITFTLIDIAR